MSEDFPPPNPNSPIWRLWRHNGLDTKGSIVCAKSGCIECHNRLISLLKCRKIIIERDAEVGITRDDRYESDVKALNEYFIFRTINPLKPKRGRPHSDETIRREILACERVVDEIRLNPSLTVEQACAIVADKYYSGSDSVRTYFYKYVKRKK
jgi:hypothetical protein